MQPSDPQPLLVQCVLNWLAVKSRENRIPLLSALIVGFLAHTFAFTNKLVNHDEVTCLFSKGATVVSGRWGLGGLDSIFPNVSMPWIYGVITIVLFAISVCVLVHILEIRNEWLQVLTAGFVLAFPSLTGTFGYMFTSSSYSVAFLLAVLSVWLLQHTSVWYWVGALLCMVLSLSIYQAYVSVAASLLVLVLIRQLLRNDDALTVLRRGVAYLVFLTLALGMYYAATQVIMQLKHVQMISYASDSITFHPLALPANILLAYQSFFLNFQEDALGLIPTLFSRKIHLLLLVCAAVLLAVHIAQMRKDALSLLLLAALIAILPLAINCLYLFITPESIHTLVLYGFVSVYLLILVLADGVLSESAAVKWAEFFRRAAINGAVILSVIIIAINIYISNEAYLTLHLRYENAYAFYTSLIADAKQSPDFTEGTRLAVIGTWDDPDFYENNLSFTHTLTGVTGIKPDSYSRERFMQYYLGFPIPFASEEEQLQIAASPEYICMPVYPYYGSMKKIGDVLVVKLS